MKIYAYLSAMAAILLALAMPRTSLAEDDIGVTGAVCNAANASDQPFIRTRPFGVTNNALVDKYVSCSLPNDADSSSTSNYLFVSFQAGSVAGEAQCVEMVGSNYNSISMFSKPAVTMAAGAKGSVAFADHMSISYTPISVSCRLSPGVELGLIWLADYSAP